MQGSPSCGEDAEVLHICLLICAASLEPRYRDSRDQGRSSRKNQERGNGASAAELVTRVRLVCSGRLPRATSGAWTAPHLPFEGIGVRAGLRPWARRQGEGPAAPRPAAGPGAPRLAQDGQPAWCRGRAALPRGRVSVAKGVSPRWLQQLPRRAGQRAAPGSGFRESSVSLGWGLGEEAGQGPPWPGQPPPAAPSSPHCAGRCGAPRGRAT